MTEFFKDQSDEWWLEHLTPLYSRLAVELDINVVKAIRKAYELHPTRSSIFLTVTEISDQTRVPWYKIFIFFAYSFGRLDAMLESLPSSEPGEPVPPS